MQLIFCVSHLSSNVLYGVSLAVKDPVKGHLLHLFVIFFLVLYFVFDNSSISSL